MTEAGAFPAVKEGMGMDVVKDVEVVKTWAGVLSFVFFVAFAPLVNLAGAWKWQRLGPFEQSKKEWV